jgi:hypothetical protein
MSMTTLLEKAVSELEQLPESEQDSMASMILAELEDDERWETSFSKSPSKLAELAARAKAQVAAGQCRAVGFDEL